MTRSELIKQLDFKPGMMPMCRECDGKKKDCEPNPLDCIDIVIQNSAVLKRLLKEDKQAV